MNYVGLIVAFLIGGGLYTVAYWQGKRAGRRSLRQELISDLRAGKTLESQIK